MNKVRKIIEGVNIEKLVFGGQALAHSEDKTIFSWNALPGETSNLDVISSRKGIIEAIAQKIINPSKDRVDPKEEHYLSCSPWQILSPESEKLWKIEIAKETFKKIGGIDLGDVRLTGGDELYGYRNKMEYSFFIDDNNELHLALFERGSHRPQPIKPCLLAQDSLNKTALYILGWIKENKIKRFDLKTLIVRSNLAGETIAALFVKKQDLSFGKLPNLDEKFKGFQLYYSTHKSPASVITSIIAKTGQEYIEETLLDAKLRYGIASFFQINIPVFEKTLRRIGEYINKGDVVVDFYSGVGAISLPLHKKISQSILADSNAEAIEFAGQNIIANGIKKYETHSVPAEKMLGEITSDRIIIFDPPRAGLHPDVIKRTSEILPETVIYLSCNISTQARDVNLLSDHYRIEYTELYDYFPRTPHFESLIILKKK